MKSQTSTQTKANLKWDDIVLVSGLLLFLFTPLVIAVFERDRTVSQIENRALTPLPALPLTKSDIKAYPALFNNYYGDHFGLREYLSGAYKELKYAMGDQPSQEVIVGKNNWLFLGKRKSKKYLDPVGFARNERLFSQHQLQTMARFYQDISTRMQAKGIAYLLVIVPNKSTIYFEEMPAHITKLRTDSATSQFVAYLESHTDVDVLDLRAPLMREKQSRQIYYKVDTHWNHHAANVAQFEIMQVLARWFPGKIAPEKISMRSEMKTGGDLGNMAHVRSLKYFQDVRPEPVFTNTCDPDVKSLNEEGRARVKETFCRGRSLNILVSRDSFFTALEPYISRQFKHAVYVWDKPTSPTVEHYLETEKFDVFVEQWVERNLDYRMLKDPREEPESGQGYR